MWPFSKPTLNDLENRAYQIYAEFGSRRRIPREERLRKKFPSVDRTTLKIWIDQFRAVEKAQVEFSATWHELDAREFESYIAKRFPFMNKKSVQRASFLLWFANR